MKTRSSLPWVLAALLQTMPLLRQVVLDQVCRAPAWVCLSRLSATAVALLGGYDAVSGASVAVSGPTSYTGTVGQSFPSTRLVTSGQAAQDWRSSPSPFASGLTISSAGRITGVPTQAGTYLVTMTAYELLGAGGASVSAQITFNISGGAGTAPAITVQPVSQTANALQNAGFSVMATGTAPLAYQWQLNGSALPGGTNAALALTAVTTNNAGNYRVVITNASGAVTSSVVTLTVNRLVPPLSWSPPVAATYGTALGPNQLNASAGAVAGTFAYSPLSGTVLGAGTRPLNVTFTPANPSVYVPNTAGVNWTINPAPLTITPNDQTRPFGQANPPLTVNFTGFVNGETAAVLTSQPVASTLADGTSAPGTYPITASGAAAANYAISYANGTLTVTSIPPTITTSPTDVTVPAGGNATFTVAATGPGPLSYQWYFNATNLLAGVTNTTLSLTNVQPGQARSYNALVINGAGAVRSGTATLTVLVPPTITNSPADLTVIQGQNARFTVGASGSPLNFQWFFNGTNALTDATNAALDLTNVTFAQTGNYSVTVTNAAGSASSAPARLTVTTAIFTSQPLPNPTFVLTSGFPLNIALEIGQNYRIEGSTNLVNWLLITNFTSTASSLQFLDSAATNNSRTYYRVVRP